MKILFKDKSYIEMMKSSTQGKVIITITAKDSRDELSLIVNSVELTVEQFEELSKDLK